MHTLADELTLQRRHFTAIQAKAERRETELIRELVSRLGWDKYIAWFDAAITDRDLTTDIVVKLRTKLEALDRHDAHRDEIPT